MAPKFVIPYRLSGKRVKNDAADAAAICEAVRTFDMRPVRVKSVEQRTLQGLHRIRSLWMDTRTSRINALSGFLREFGIAVPGGARTGLQAISRVPADPACATLLSIPGVGLLTATALVAATSGDVTHFKDARHFARRFGLTPREYSSGSSHCLGKISKRGDRYLRMLLTHGARSVLRTATVPAARAAKSQTTDIRLLAPFNSQNP